MQWDVKIARQPLNQSINQDSIGSSNCASENCGSAKLFSATNRSFRQSLIENELTDYYNLYLQRKPDDAGLQFWSNHVSQNTVTMSQAKHALKNSPEALLLGPPPEYQLIPRANHTETTCSAGSTKIGRALSSREGYVTRYSNDLAGSSYPRKAQYKQSYTRYCVKQRIRCWAGQVRTKTVSIRPSFRGASCGALHFRNKPETSYQYIKALNEDFIEIYETCHNRKPTAAETDKHITSVVEQNGTVYENAASICSW